MGDFESARRYARQGVQIWRSGGVKFPPEDLDTPVVVCLCHEALSEWHFGETLACQATIGEAISLAKEHNDMNALALALQYAAYIGHYERNFAVVERFASELIELSTRHNFAYWLAMGCIFCGWARSVSGSTEEGLPWIERGIRDRRANGSTLFVPFWLAQKAEALHVANRTSDALEAIREAEAVVERSEERCWCAELNRLRGVFLAAMGAEEGQVEASLQEAIRIAKEQKSVSLEKRAEGTYAEYRRQKASASGGRGFRLRIC